jgi:class 3 adenylate cyclase
VIELQRIEQDIATLEAHRATLGEALVETCIAALRNTSSELDWQETVTSALRGERKLVTVMFADISGFTAMSERLDPEEVRSVINACFERLGAVIDRYEGHIDKFIGDEIMALFGAPVAHENDPERALRAALDMKVALEAFNTEFVQYISKPLSLHFGINSGLVIAGGIGTNQRKDYSVIGDTVNLASRLEGLSEAGEILVGESTYRLTSPFFEFEALKPVMVKGKEKPVQVYCLLQAKTSVASQVRGIEGLSSPLVGRQHEMGTLIEAMNNLQNGQGSVISVIGEAGLGKSRLVAELHLITNTQTQPVQVRWAEGQALSYGESASYLVTRNIMHNLLGINPETSPIELGSVLRSEMDHLFPGQAAEIYPYLAYLLEAPLDKETVQRVNYLDGEVLHQRILQSMQSYISAKAKQNPLVLVWEDLHWVDPSSLGLLEALLPLTQQCPLSLFLVYRPRREKRIWEFHHRFVNTVDNVHTIIELSSLTFEESDQLLNNLLGVCDLPESTYRSILNKAEGNPFYLEEVIRSLIDSGILTRAEDDQCWMVNEGIEDIQIPDTLQGVIMARIDRLDPETKRTLQVASVIGRSFPYQVLAHVLGKIN